MTVFWFLVFWLLFFSKKNVFVFSQWKLTWLSYEVSFFSALGMVSSESWKIFHSIYYAHDCIWQCINRVMVFKFFVHSVNNTCCPLLYIISLWLQTDWFCTPEIETPYPNCHYLTAYPVVTWQARLNRSSSHVLMHTNQATHTTVDLEIY